MARRHYIGFTSRGPSIFRNVRLDETGRPLLFLEEGEIARLELDFQSFVETGETISSATVAPDNVTAVIANDTTSATITFSAANEWGEVIVTVTFSTGDVWSDKIRVRNQRRINMARRTTDYHEFHP